MDSAAVRGENLRFSESGVQEVLRSIILPLWNAYSFFATYATVDGWEPSGGNGGTAPSADPLAALRPTAASRRHRLDRWILSAQQRLVRVVTESMESYELQRAIEPIVHFIDDLTNWYVRRSRRRFWKSENDADKQQAYETLYAVLLDTCRILAPYTPFIADEIYRNLSAPVRAQSGAADSVHLCDWPEYRADEEDTELDERMDIVIRTVSMGRALRTAHGLKVRQPLQALHVATRDVRTRSALAEMSDLVLDELNIKELKIGEREDDLVTFTVKANFKTLGPKLGKDVQRAAKAIAALPVPTVLAIEAGEPYPLVVDDLSVVLEPADVIVQRNERAGLFVECQGALAVALDPQLTPALVEEGHAREFVNRVQNLRKETGLKVMDRIRIRFHTASGELQRALERHAAVIRSETQADALEASAVPLGNGSTTDLNGQACDIGIERTGS
jgi:isoleucyl-tRNA synthetase